MQVRGSQLRIGDVARSGEIVKNVFSLDSKKIEVTLENPKTGKIRKGIWNKNGTIFIEARAEGV